MTVLFGTRFVTITEAARMLGRSRRLVGHLIELHGVETRAAGPCKMIGPAGVRRLRQLIKDRREVRERKAS